MLSRSLGELYSRPLDPLQEWIPGILPKQAIWLLGGLAKIGKSFLMTEIGFSLASGAPLFGCWPVVEGPKGVLYIEQENGQWELQRRIKTRFHSSPPGNYWYISQAEGMLIDMGGLERIAGEIEALGANILLLDPASYFLMGDENSNTDVGRFNRLLRTLISRSPGLSIILSHHFGKPPREYPRGPHHDPNDFLNFRGASKWGDFANTLTTIHRPEASGITLLSSWTTRHGISPGEIDLKLFPWGEVWRA